MIDAAYAERREHLAAKLRAGGSYGRIRLAKPTSNLFRDRRAHHDRALEVASFDHVLAVDAATGRVDAEGMVPYDALVAATLMHDCMPAVVPELKSITLGGATAGVGIEATSFRHGLVHETIDEMDILLADGSVVCASPGNEHADLFYGFANSDGTLGSALRLRAHTIPTRPFVKAERAHYHRADVFFRDLAAACRSDADFVEGVVFAEHDLSISCARFVATAPYLSDYRYERIYYRSIRDHPVDYLRVEDYIWRWDTDWFWCSKNLGAQHPLMRRLFGRARLNSRSYTRIMRLNSRLGLTRTLDRIRGVAPESVIQDVDIPIDRAAEFLDFFHREIGILPIWVCPIGPSRASRRFTLYPLDPDTLHVNFGFWDVVRSTTRHPPAHFNRLIEHKVRELGGIKSLYSESYFAEDEFWSIFDRVAYERLKARYDPERRLGDLYGKCVLRQ